jgi:heptosyltransferase II
MSAVHQSDVARMAAESRRPLIVRLCNWVGEVVLSMPALRRLEGAGYELYLVGKGWSPALLEGSGWQVLVRPKGLGVAVLQLRDLKTQLAATMPSPRAAARALLMTKSLSSALETRLAGLAAAGYAHDGRSLLLAAAYSLPHFEHASHAYWHLVDRFLGEQAPYPKVAELSPSAAQGQAADSILASRQLVANKYVLLCPLSGADDKDGRKVWPGFAELGRLLHARSVPLVVCPGPGEEQVAAAVLPQALQLTGIDLGIYAALLERAQCVVANDTGPGHLAAAVGARCLSIYGPQSVAAWSPLGRRVELLHLPSAWPDVASVAAAVLTSR